MKIVVIGGGQASFSFIQKLRDLGHRAEILLLCAERKYPYQRPPLSKRYLWSNVPAEKLYFRDQRWYEKQAVEVKLGEKATRIDCRKKIVETSSGERIPYDILFLGLGGKTRELPPTITNGVYKGVHSIRDIVDVESLKQELLDVNNVLIMGGGYLGLEIASSLVMLEKKVRVIEAGTRILGRVACEETSKFLRSLHEERGVSIQEGVGVSCLKGCKDRRFAGLKMVDGQEFRADLLLVAIGMVARDELAISAGLACDKGILVDSFGQTSEDGIYAAGDGTRFRYKGEWVNFESVYQAKMMAELAAEQVHGTVRKAIEPLPWFWTDQYDVKVQTVGYGVDYEDVWVRSGKRDGSYSHWYFDKKGQLLKIDSLMDVEGYQVGKILLEKGIPCTRKHLENSENIRELVKRM